VQGHRHGLVPVFVPPQFLPVAGDQKQRVVGASAQHQHDQDAAALPVDGQSGVRGEQVDDRLGDDQATPEAMIGSSHSTGLR
jgi:hypothetical protein